jgi:putative tryptophan/tyrosine transport system substrate-binding protein
MRLLGKLSVAAFVLSLMCGLSNAQQNPKRVGIPINGGPTPLFDSIKKNLLSDFAELGYVEGRDVVIEPRFAELKLERLPSLASELANANVDVIVALGGPASVAAQRATSTIPVIFSIVTDPVALKLVASMEKPGSNVTGITSLDPQQTSKQFELLKEVFPGIKRVAILSDQLFPVPMNTGWRRSIAPTKRQPGPWG